MVHPQTMAVLRPGDCSFLVIEEDHRWQEGSTLTGTGELVDNVLVRCLENRLRHDSAAVIGTIQERTDSIVRSEKEDWKVFEIRDIKTFDGTFI